jgi:hypothetical protein
MEQKSITFKGLSRAASDVRVADGVCCESVNVVLDNNELMPVIPPTPVGGFPIGVNYKVVYVHKTANYTHYIGVIDNMFVGWVNENTTSDSGFYEIMGDLLSIRGVGNILVIATSLENVYVLFDVEQNKYTLLGSQVPEPIVDYHQESTSSMDVNFGVDLEPILKTIDPLFEIKDNDNPLQSVRKGVSKDEIIYADDPRYSSLTDGEKKISQAYSLISEKAWSKFSSAYRKSYNNNTIPQPVFMRFAVRLYDGSYTRHSVPIMIDPFNFTNESIFTHLSLYTANNDDYGSMRIVGKVANCKLSFDILNADELLKWKDIIQGVDFFFSEPIYLTKFGSKITRVANTNSDSYYSSNCFIKQYTDSEYELEILEKNAFYEVKRIDIEKLKEQTSYEFDEIADKFGDILPTQRRLPNGYNTNHELRAKYLYKYNKRLNMCGVEQLLCNGLYNVGSKTQSDNQIRGDMYQFMYHIKSDDGVVVIGRMQYLNDSDTNDTNIGRVGSWVAYPDSRCFKVEIYKQDGQSIYKETREMKSHPFLNIAYNFDRDREYFTVQEYPRYDTFAMEVLSNKLYQSEVNNPFVFMASGIHTIPVNKIMGVTSTSEPISQGQFGQYPLYVFTDEGVWSMNLDNTGKYINMAPMAREICNNPQSITNASGVVLFTTNKGLMQLQGGNIVDLSYDMRGKSLKLDSTDDSLPYLEEVMAREGVFLPSKISENVSFLDYLKDCFIAYDYLNYRVILVNSKCNYQYVYSLTNNSWHKLCLDQKFVNTFNNYPECYLQADDGLVYNFSAIDDIDSYTDKVSGLVVTRAMTLDAPSIRKRIDDLRVRGEYDKGSVVRLLYGSYDSVHWTYINSLKGKSFPYYKLALVFKLLPKQRLNSIDILFTPRWNNKLR